MARVFAPIPPRKATSPALFCDAQDDGDRCECPGGNSDSEPAGTRGAGGHAWSRDPRGRQPDSASGASVAHHISSAE
ncbi:unnamed protein product [Lampetra fluviatilis]